IGEPGTQLTMRTKHSGGIGTGAGDIVGGLPRVEEIFERRTPKNQATLSQVAGEVLEVKPEGRDIIISILPDLEHRKKSAKAGEQIDYTVAASRTLLVAKGDKVEKGQPLVEGSIDLSELYKLAGKTKTEDYIIKETNAIYELQGVSIARKHIEIIIRQMMARRRVKVPGLTKFTVGELVEQLELHEENERVEAEDGEVATADQVILGISEVALSTASFLSAVSFQHTTRVLIDTAIKGGLDKLRGLKENVIIGRLIPAGTGLDKGFGRETEGEQTPATYQVPGEAAAE
ncbi:MAG: DNA-directed RNA polymerase subunit beta', partial [Candidatus Vogelbacteria bacterium]|nr:DNA-directed RNA polymerase subunit beta' [Candidatus Vogelbacteria bacterium]